MSDCHVRANCRLCYGPIEKAFGLTATPPANELVDIEFIASKKIQDEFPLFISVCKSCGHVQLPVVVNPERLFRHYTYTSGVSPAFVAHFRSYAEQIVQDYNLQANDLVVDIGSNDGTLLKAFRYHGTRVLGVDPAVNISKLAIQSGIETIPEFFDSKIANKIVQQFGKAKVIVANNMFAHIDKPEIIVDGVNQLLDPNGVFVFENSYLPDLIQNTLYDQIYHEHLSYHHLAPLSIFFRRHNLDLFDAHRVYTQGGSFRAFVKRHAICTDRLQKLYDEEHFLGLRVPFAATPADGIQPLKDLFVKVDKLKDETLSLLKDLKSKGKVIAGFGAPAKCVTLMHHFGFGNDILDFIVEDSPLKQGLYTPGKNIPIVSPEALYAHKRPDYVVILAWNFADSIVKKHTKFIENGGKFIIPLPKVQIIG